MKLDDRPVIDQLLNPTPLNHLYEVAGDMHDMVCNNDQKVQESVDGHLFPLLDLVDPDERDAAFDSISQVAEAVTVDSQARALDLLHDFALALEARL